MNAKPTDPAKCECGASFIIRVDGFPVCAAAAAQYLARYGKPIATKV